jgi:NAD+ diphosphatase
MIFCVWRGRFRQHRFCYDSRISENQQRKSSMSGFDLFYMRPKIIVDAIIFPFVGENLLIGAGATLPSIETLRALGDDWQAIHFGRLDGQLCEMRVWPQTIALPPGLMAGDFRRLWSIWPSARLEALVRARQLAAWLAHHRFCGVCGQATEIHPAEPACVCHACGHKAYPRISPVCMGLVLRGKEMLLARSPHFPPGVYSALAGFVEAGESAEAALRREIFEEAGVRIRNIRWFGSQTWPYPHSLMLGFIADYASGELVAQAGEIEALGWFGFDRLPDLPHPASLAYRMIEHARDRCARPSSR